MVVDDDKDICFTVETIGAYAGWQVRSFLDVNSAFMALDDFDPDILLLDYHLPFMTGLEALPNFRKRKPSLPIVMLTVEEDAELAEKCLKAGADDYSLKPIKALDFIHRVDLNLRIARLRKQEPTALPLQLEKGLSHATIELVLNHFNSNYGVYFTIDEIAAALNLGYSTAHRYLNYLEERGYFTVAHGYGRQGRPRKKYKMVK